MTALVVADFVLLVVSLVVLVAYEAVQRLRTRSRRIEEEKRASLARVGAIERAAIAEMTRIVMTSRLNPPRQ